MIELVRAQVEASRAVDEGEIVGVADGEESNAALPDPLLVRHNLSAVEHGFTGIGYLGNHPDGSEHALTCELRLERSLEAIDRDQHLTTPQLGEGIQGGCEVHCHISSLGRRADGNEAVVPADLAERWTQSVVPSAHLHLLGAQVTLHGGPFLNLAALMGLAATATFLSFALIEDRFARALAGALLQDPIDRFLVLALPYAFLWERAIDAGWSARQARS